MHLHLRLRLHHAPALERLRRARHPVPRAALRVAPRAPIPHGPFLMISYLRAWMTWLRWSDF